MYESGSDCRFLATEFQRILEVQPEPGVRLCSNTKYRILLSGKFMILEIRERDEDGFTAVIVFPDPEVRFLRLWVYNLDENEYELRHIEELFAIPGHRANLKRLTKNKFKQFLL